MKKIFLLLFIFISFQKTNAQTFITRNGYIGFFSKTPLEDIRAENRQVYAVIDASNKNLAFV